MNNMILHIQKWKEDTFKQKETVYQITEYPLNQINPYPQVYHDFEGKPIYTPGFADYNRPVDLEQTK